MMDNSGDAAAQYRSAQNPPAVHEMDVPLDPEVERGVRRL
jgi:hypothetical protein